MEKEYKTMNTIRGIRESIELTKRVKGFPGFAPEYRDRLICEVVFNFPHGDGETYVDFVDKVPALSREDIEEILDVMDNGYVNELFPVLEGGE